MQIVYDICGVRIQIYYRARQLTVVMMRVSQQQRQNVKHRLCDGRGWDDMMRCCRVAVGNYSAALNYYMRLDARPAAGRSALYFVGIICWFDLAATPYMLA